MQLDKERGEILGGLGAPHVVSPEDYDDLNKVRFEVEIDRPDGKWPDKRMISILDHACLLATQAFLKEGALWPVEFDERSILVQWYPSKATIVILFQHSVRGQLKFRHYTYKPTEKHIRWLCYRRNWPKPTQSEQLTDAPRELGEALN